MKNSNVPYFRSEGYYDALYSFKNYKLEVAKLNEVFIDYEVEVSSILDVACGTHEHCKYFSKKYHIDGIDINENFIRIAKTKNPSSIYHLENMTNFRLGRTYDAVICLSSSIGYLSGITELSSCISSMVKHVRPGGVVIIEPWYSPETWRGNEVFTTNGVKGNVHVSRIGVRGRKGRRSYIDFHYLIAGKDLVETYTEHHDLFLFTKEEVLHELNACGLSVGYDESWSKGRGLYIGKRPI